MDRLVVIPADEQQRRLTKVKAQMKLQGIEHALICSNANIYYLTGRVYSGYIYIGIDTEPYYLVKRPVHLTDPNALEIRKPENITEQLASRGVILTGNIALELNHLTYNMAMRLCAALQIKDVADISMALQLARATKTPYEIDEIRESGYKHTAVYQRIPSLYRPGMSDIELQIEIERQSRLEGCLGQFRIAGDDMELYMGNILAGDNADAPSPYDFAMGGAGIDTSLPVGANGTIIKKGMTIMVDMNGNFTGYMTDMTRCFAVGEVSQKAKDAHQLSIDICTTIAGLGTPGVEAKSLYEKAVAMVKESGFEDYFMGHRQHAGFIGHGIGIEINELPVIAPRSRSILQPGNVIALEPKFVIPGTGAVGIENTYVVKEDGAMECLTKAPEQLIDIE